MKKQKVEAYRDVVFQDLVTGKAFLTRSTAQSHGTIDYEGKQYPLVKVDVTSDSHPVFTGKVRPTVAHGRADAFRKRYAK